MSKGRKAANGLMLATLESIQNIIGANGLKSVLNYAHLEGYVNSFPPNNSELEIPVKDIQNLYLSLKTLFGNKGVRSIQLRVGSENAKRALDNRPAMAKSIKLATRLIPETTKMNLVLEKFGEDLEKNLPSEEGSSHIEVKEEEDCFLFIDTDNFESEGVTSNVPVCNVNVGMLSYIMEWITGHPHKVEEIECRAMGDSRDVFRIEKARKERS